MAIQHPITFSGFEKGLFSHDITIKDQDAVTRKECVCLEAQTVVMDDSSSQHPFPPYNS